MPATLSVMPAITLWRTMRIERRPIEIGPDASKWTEARSHGGSTSLQDIPDLTCAPRFPFGAGVARSHRSDGLEQSSAGVWTPDHLSNVATSSL